MIKNIVFEKKNQNSNVQKFLSFIFLISEITFLSSFLNWIQYFEEKLIKLVRFFLINFFCLSNVSGKISENAS